MTSTINSPRTLWPPRILWVDDDRDILASAQRLFRGQAFVFQSTTSVAEAKAWLRQQLYSVIVADQRLNEESGIDLLEFARRHSPASTRILLTGFVDQNVIEDAVNRAAVFRFINKPWDNNELSLDINKAIEHHRLKVEQAGLLREVSLQNKRLEQLTSGLEKLVAERTLDAERSRDEAEKQLQRMRQLVKFIKDLSALNSIEELMLLLAKEVRPFNSIRAPILAYMASERRAMMVSFQGKQLIEKETSAFWSSSVRIRVNDADDRHDLANLFGRPFVKVIAVPLKRRLGQSQKDSDSEPPATLFFEHSFQDSEVSGFVQSISERLQPLSLALDRILLDYHLRLTSIQWESTFDGIKDPIAIVDERFHLIRSNRQFHGGGFSNSCHLTFAERSSPCAGCPVEAAIASKVPQKRQIKRGEKVYEVHSYPIHLSNENERNLKNVINYYLDVTAARELQSRVVQNEKMAAIGLLAGNIAHELNNPLTGIRSLAQVLIHETDPQDPSQSQIHKDILEVESAAARSQKIIENLLDFSKSGNGNKQTEISLNQIVQRTLPMLKTALREHRSEIQMTEDPITVRVEPHLMQQVFFNLVNNACQAMKDPGTLRIETRQSEDQRYAELVVSDTGPGIPPEIRDRIFEPFFTTKEEGEGTGLGLSMSQSVVASFGGRIRVESEIGKGASFTVQLPLASGSV